MTSKYTRAARDQNCTVRGPTCSHNPETVVFAHLNGGGMGLKKNDIAGAFACYDCHVFLDYGYVEHGVKRLDRDYLHLRATIETQEKLIKMGVLIL